MGLPSRVPRCHPNLPRSLPAAGRVAVEHRRGAGATDHLDIVARAAYALGAWPERVRDQLDDLERALLVLRIDRGLFWIEIAEVLAEDGAAVGEAALRKRFERLKTKLRQLLAEFEH